MKGSLTNKSKWFWAWQDDREEAWLSEMARQGLHLQHAGLFGQYTFEQGAPRDVAYRLDFITQSKKKPDYFQLFQDAGWEHVGEMGGWQYWRKDVEDGKATEIFTDNASKIQKYQRLLGFLVIFFSIYTLFLSNYGNNLSQSGGGFFSMIYEILFFVVVMLYLFAMVMIIRRVSILKRKI